MTVNLLSNLGAKTEEDTMSSWLQILQKNSKSTEQLQMEMIESTSAKLKEIQEKAQEKAEEEKQKEAQNEDAVQVSVGSGEVQASSEVPDTEPVSTVEVSA